MAAPTNGAAPTAPKAGVKARVVLAGKAARILCVADIRGDFHELNRLIREHEASAVIHTGDFGFLDSSSLDRMGDKILRHLLQYSPLIPPATRSQLLALPQPAPRATLIQQLTATSVHFPLSQFPHLLTGAITFPVPVFTTWGLIEDVRIIEKFRTGEYEVGNLHILDEAASLPVEVGGLKLRLFGLGGAIAMHKLFDNGEGYGTIAGGQGTMWTTALQIGELVQTAQNSYDPSEVRLFVASAPISRLGLLAQLSLALRADLTVSGGLHFRYSASYNEFAVHADLESYRQKLGLARDSFMGVYDMVKDRVDSSMNDQQHALLQKAINAVQKLPSADDPAWTNAWHWVLCDASCGSLMFNVSEGRVSAETKSNGLTFAHRTTQSAAPPSAAPSQPSGQTSIAPPARPNDIRTAARPPMPAAAPNVVRPPAPAAKPVLPRGPAGPTVRPIGPGPGGSNFNPLVRPTQPTRAPRGPGGPAGFNGQASDAAGTKSDAKADAKAVEGKAEGKQDHKQAEKRGGTPVQPKGANGRAEKQDKAEKGEKADKQDKQDKVGKQDKTEKADDAANGTATASTSGANGDKEAASKESSPPASPTPRRFSLYIKGLPVPTSEAEIKEVFTGHVEKITLVKLVFDGFRKQKPFAYVEFANEGDMQAALAAHPSGTVKDSPVSVEVSNPPRAGERRPGRGGFRGPRLAHKASGSVGQGKKD